jgi:hypothetical protein
MKQIAMIPIAWLVVLSAWLMPTDKMQGGAHPASSPGRFEGVRVMRNLPLALPVRPSPRKFEDNDSDSGALLERVSKTRIIPTDLAQTLAPQLATQAGTIPALQRFLPPNAIDQTECGGLLVPDGALAANPNYLLEVSNFCFKVLNPASGAVLAGPTLLQNFFNTTEVSDERALYDPVNQRFIMIGDDHARNLIFLAVTQSANPMQGWNIYSFSAAGSCNPGNGDFPSLGQTLEEPGDPKGGIYLAWNIGCPPNGLQVFVGAISKTAAYAGQSITKINGFQGLTINGTHVDSVQPVNVMNPGDHPRGEFLINSFDQYFGGGWCSSGCNGVVIWDFYNGVPASGASQSLSSTVVATTNTYYLPANAPEPGCAVNACGPNAGPPIISGQTTYSAGSIFAALNDAKGILALEVEPFVSDAGVITGGRKRNEICFACGGFSNGGSAYYGTIQPDSERNFVMVYSYSAPGTAGCTPNATNCIYPSAAYVSRRVTQAQNTFPDQGTILQLGNSYYHQLNPQGVNRWGDYSAAAPNYAKANSFWIEGEYSQNTTNWGKAVGQTAFTSPSGP